MAQIELGSTQNHRPRALSSRAVVALLVGTIVVGQSAWLGLLGYGAWHLVFG
ncbi:hypothetical protein [Bosea sp. MMO-172]|uniref:hypothetical protein n=1 Tax=Bosea sp. MMO-172 TaxID=3127885 RepID=UPI0030179B75